LEPEEHLGLGFEALEERLLEFGRTRFQDKFNRLGDELAGQLQKFVLIQILDQQWRDHLNELIMLRSGIGLRSYGQRDPLVEYKSESFRMFEALMDGIERAAINLFFRAELAPPPPVKAPPVAKLETQHQEVSAYNSGPTEGAAPPRPQGPPETGGRRPIQREEPKVGRNDPCTCGSGKKFKRCCGS
jgi:preprotein translocase subunit SecA